MEKWREVAVEEEEGGFGSFRRGRRFLEFNGRSLMLDFLYGGGVPV